MKQRIFMYLFVFSALLVLFQYINSKRVFEELNTKLSDYKTQLKTYKDTINVVENAVLEASHFNLEHNEDAISYFEKEGYNVAELIPYIKDKLYELNEVKGEHPLVPYGSGEGRKMLINTIKLLNHKWIIADFSDGQYWGEMLLTYEINKNKTATFNVVESFLYPFD